MTWHLAQLNIERLNEGYLVLWWIPAGTVPTIEEALAGANT